LTKVFVTGASGFIAKHILRELLAQGYDVRASVRSDKRRRDLVGLFPDASLEFATLDLTKDEGWQDALKGCDVLIHTASPFPLTEPKDPQDLIRPAVDGTLRALRAARDAGITRVILTSSCAAIYKQADKPKMQPSDETNWTTPDDPSVGAYEASKTLAEKAAWDFVADHPDIALTTINPGAVFGPPMDARYGSSLELVEQLMTGKVPMAPPMDMVAMSRPSTWRPPRVSVLRPPVGRIVSWSLAISSRGGMPASRRRGARRLSGCCASWVCFSRT